MQRILSMGKISGQRDKGKGREKPRETENGETTKAWEAGGVATGDSTEETEKERVVEREQNDDDEEGRRGSSSVEEEEAEEEKAEEEENLSSSGSARRPSRERAPSPGPQATLE